MSERMPPPPQRGKRPAAVMEPTGTVTDASGRVRNVIQVGPSELPPPGDARREELKRRDDDLGERLARIEEALGLDSSGGPQVDLRTYRVDNEIASKIDLVNVDNAQPEFHYYWANFASQHGLDVKLHEVMGYELVCGDMPEARKAKDELGRRRIGDTVLMRIPLDEKLKLDQLDRQRRMQREGGILSTLEGMSDRFGRRGVRFYPNLNEYQMGRAMRQAQAQQIARQQFNDMVRGGRAPGLPVGR